METNLNRVFLSIEEMQKLTSYGLDTSDARYCYVKKNTEEYDGSYEGSLNSSMSVVPYDEFCKTNENSVIPTYTAEELLNKIPHRLECFDEELAFDFEMWKSINKEDGNIYWILAFIPDENCPEDIMELNYVINENLLDAAYEMLLWALKYNYIKQ